MIANKLETKEYTSGPLISNIPGYYFELLIKNLSLEDVYVVDHENNKVMVRPAFDTINSLEVISVSWRRTLDPTRTQNGAPASVAAFHIDIPKHTLMSVGHVYIRQINLLICLNECVYEVWHPCMAKSADRASYELHKHVVELMKGVPTIAFHISDPEGRYSHLYSVLGNQVISIPVSKEFKRTALTMTYNQSGDKLTEVSVDLTDFFNSGEQVIELKDCPLGFLTTNRSIAERSYQEYRKVSQTEVNKLLKERDDKHKKELEVTVNETSSGYETQLSVKDREIATLKSKLAVLQSEHDRLQSEYSAFTGNINAGMKIGETELKRDKAIADSTTEHWKTVGIYGTLALGAITLLLKAIQLGSKTGLIV